LIADVAFSQHVSLPTPRIAFKAAGPLVLLRFDKTRWRVFGIADAREGDEAADRNRESRYVFGCSPAMSL
jgi:hypothetical protein